MDYCYSGTHRADKHLIFEQNRCLQVGDHREENANSMILLLKGLENALLR